MALCYLIAVRRLVKSGTFPVLPLIPAYSIGDLQDSSFQSAAADLLTSLMSVSLDISDMLLKHPYIFSAFCCTSWFLLPCQYCSW